MNEQFIIPRGCDFDKIGHKFTSNDCSPQIVNHDFTGVLINVPKQILVDANFSLPLACAFAHDVSQPLNLTKHFKNSIVFVVVNSEANETYSGSFRVIENRIPPPKVNKED